MKKTVISKKLTPLLLAAALLSLSSVGCASTNSVALNTSRIADRSSVTQDRSFIAQLSMACNDYYSRIKAGEINKDNPGEVRSVSELERLPEAGAGAAERKAAAGKCTVQGALEFGGLDRLITDLSDYTYDNSGNIYNRNFTEVPGAKMFTFETTLGALYEK